MHGHDRSPAYEWEGESPRGLKVEGEICHPRARRESLSLVLARLRGMVRRRSALVPEDLLLQRPLAAFSPGRVGAAGGPRTRAKLRWVAVRWLRRDWRRHASGFLPPYT